MRCARRLPRLLLVATLGVSGVLVIATPSASQTTVVVEGRVVDPSGAGIANATVALDGIGFRLTDEDGAFRFGAVPPRSYTARVEGLGYESLAMVIEADRDLVLDIALSVAPLLLDSIVVESRTVEIEGRVWDPVRDAPVASAAIVSNQADPTRTSWGGRFKIKVGDGVPVRVIIRAFRYMPLDTVFVPRGDHTYHFDLEADPLIARMIDIEIARLDERAGGRRAVAMNPLNREDLERWRGATLLDVLKARFPSRWRRVRCVILNERDVGRPMLRPTLQITLADEVERMEFLFGGAMLRVYTKEFMRKMIGGGLELRRPVYSDMARPPLCL